MEREETNIGAEQETLGRAYANHISFLSQYHPKSINRPFLVFITFLSCILFLSQYSPKESDAGYMRMEGAPCPESTVDYDYADPLELNKLFRISHSESEHVKEMKISLGDLGDVASEPPPPPPQQQQQQENCGGVRASVSSNDSNYEDAENIDVRNSFSMARAVTNDECPGANCFSSAPSYENVPGGCLDHLSREGSNHSPGGTLDCEEYVEMGKRRSMMIVESPDPSGCHGFEKIEEEGHEYFVLEGMGTSEGEF